MCWVAGAECCSQIAVVWREMCRVVGLLTKLTGLSSGLCCGSLCCGLTAVGLLGLVIKGLAVLAEVALIAV